MTQQTPFKLPIKLLILDGIGSLLIVLGVLALVADLHLLPAAWRVARYDIVLIILGATLMLPMLLWIMEQVKRRRP
jgi:hypothetical protein